VLQITKYCKVQQDAKQMSRRIVHMDFTEEYCRQINVSPIQTVPTRLLFLEEAFAIVF
jgi:hypothetical protein